MFHYVNKSRFSPIPLCNAKSRSERFRKKETSSDLLYHFEWKVVSGRIHSFKLVNFYSGFAQFDDELNMP